MRTNSLMSLPFSFVCYLNEQVVTNPIKIDGKIWDNNRQTFYLDLKMLFITINFNFKSGKSVKMFIDFKRKGIEYNHDVIK